MKRIFTLLFAFTAGFAFAQTTEYTTGQTFSDAWTGWSTPIETGTTASSVNGADIYTFSGMNGQAYTVELYRQFSINSNDIDLYLNATCANATVSIEYSSDNSSYTEIGSIAFGGGFSQQGLIIPTYDPVVSSFYLKIKVAGTFGSPSSLQLNNLKIDAVLNTGSNVSISPTSTQNILTSANGTALTANESPSAADSREWKYSTTSGSGYGSFSPAQTSASYTPNFAAVGTYYVVCESTFGGDVESSNEVQVNVTAPSGLVEFNDSYKFLKTTSRVDIITNDQNYMVRIYDLTGKLISSEMSMTSFDFADLHKGLYFLSVETETGIKQTIKFVHR